MMGDFTRVIVAVGLLIAMGGCAEGFSVEQGTLQTLYEEQPNAGTQSDDGDSMEVSTADSMMSMDTDDGMCRLGTSKDCTCDNEDMGQANCLSDGTYGTCRCDGMDATGGDLTGSGGTGSDSGSSGLSGSVAGTTAGTAGLSGSGSGGSAGLSANAPVTGGGCSGGCTQSCFPIGIVACCRDSGTCGCTWAPGGYCS